MKHIIFYIYITFIFTGCTYTSYQYVDPITYNGKQCIEECQNTKYTCQDIKNRENRYYEKKYQKNMELYTNCIDSKNINHQNKRYEKKKRKYIKQCMRHNSIKNCKKQYGSFHPIKRKCDRPTKYYSNKECSSHYNSCFRGCGGEIIAVEKDLF